MWYVMYVYVGYGVGSGMCVQYVYGVCMACGMYVWRAG